MAYVVFVSLMLIVTCVHVVTLATLNARISPDAIDLVQPVSVESCPLVVVVNVIGAVALILSAATGWVAPESKLEYVVFQTSIETEPDCLATTVHCTMVAAKSNCDVQLPAAPVVKTLVPSPITTTRSIVAVVARVAPADMVAPVKAGIEAVLS